MNSRAIKFRVWYQNEYLKPYAYLIDNAGNIYWTLGGNRLELAENQKDFVVEQFTGLLDKNGVEIYEGDIVFVKNKLFNESYSTATKTLVYYDFLGFHFQRVPNNRGENKIILKDSELEVIGNTHQNPELLKN